MVWCHTLSVNWYQVKKAQELVSRFLERCSKQMNLDENSVPRPLTTVSFYTDKPKEDLITQFEENVQVLSSTKQDEKNVVAMGKEDFLLGAQFAGFYLKNGTFNIVKSISNTTIVIYRSQSKHSWELCRVLEKVVFSQLLEKLKYLEQELEQLSTGQSRLGDNEMERRQIVEDLIGDIIALFNRSSIETILHPKIPELKLKTISDKVAQELFEVDKSIKGVGYRVSTLQIDMVEEQDKIKHDRREIAIKQYLSKAGIKQFELRYVSPSETLFTRSGTICFTNGEMATLGCFAYKKNNEDSKTLCALVARHFADKSKEVDFKVYMEGEVKLGTVMESTITEEGYDIAAVTVDKNLEAVCERTFRNSIGDFVPGNLYERIEYDEDYKKLQNMEVYIWGTSKEKQPGYGKIIIPKYIRSDNPRPHVKVMDQDSSRRMAIKKDSGGIICIDSTKENAVTLIAMLKGSTEEDEYIKANPGRKREYVTFLLRKGLEQLYDQTHCQFEIA